MSTRPTEQPANYDLRFQLELERLLAAKRADEAGGAGMKFVPCTPGGTLCFWLAANTEQKAINALLKDASHMPYGTWENFQKRGYTIEQMERVP